MVNHPCWHKLSRLNLALALAAGFSAGVVATLAQTALWYLAEIPVLDTLLRDARLTAALLMGAEALTAKPGLAWDILLVATVIHFALSVFYALIPAAAAGRLRTWPALGAGALYGVVIYVVNLHGFTLLFPWFAVTRGWVTLAAHLVFGVTLTASCLIFARHCRR